MPNSIKDQIVRVLIVWKLQFEVSNMALQEPQYIGQNCKVKSLFKYRLSS